MNNSITLFSTPDTHKNSTNIKENLTWIWIEKKIENNCIDYEYFSDWSPRLLLSESVRGNSVVILSDLFSHTNTKTGSSPSINDKYISTRALIKTVKDFWADIITVILPCFPYARDDKYDHNWCSDTKKRKPNLANLAVNDMINDNVSHVITVDLHNDATFNRTTNTKFINLSPGWLFKKIIHDMQLDSSNTLLSWTDAGSKKKIEAISKDLQINHITTLKERDYSQDQKISQVSVYWDCYGKNIILYDDMIDTWWTMIECIKAIKAKWAKSIHVIASHGMFHWDSITQFNSLYNEGTIQSLSITDSITHSNLPDWINVIELSTLYTNTLLSLFNNKDIHYNAGETILK